MKRSLLVALCAVQITMTAQEKKAVVLISVPKCGTHLLKKCVRLLTQQTHIPFDALTKKPITGPTGRHVCTWLRPLVKKALTHLDSYPQLLFDSGSLSHLPYTKENAAILNNPKIANFLIVRDPRDQILSFAHWKKKQVSLYPQLKNVELDDIILDLIKEGKSNYPIWQCNITHFYEMYLKWLELNNLCLIKFEALVGPDGGGSKKDQIAEIKKIAQHIGIKITDSRAEEIGSQLFGNTATFRKGQIGRWKEEFKPFHRAAFNNQPGALKLVEKLGYQKD